METSHGSRKNHGGAKPSTDIDIDNLSDETKKTCDGSLVGTVSDAYANQKGSKKKREKRFFRVSVCICLVFCCCCVQRRLRALRARTTDRASRRFCQELESASISLYVVLSQPPACMCMPSSLACRSSSVTTCVSAAGLDLSMPSSCLVSIRHQSLDARVEVRHLIDTCGGTVAGRRRRCCSSTGRCRAGRDTTTAGERCRADAVAKV